jgi:hypothetical protein
LKTFGQNKFILVSLKVSYILFHPTAKTTFSFYLPWSPSFAVILANKMADEVEVKAEAEAEAEAAKTIKRGLASLRQLEQQTALA